MMLAPMTEGDERSQTLSQAWDDAAVGYDDYFVPRFEPWFQDAIGALGGASPLPEQGALAVPCCGPGRELQLLARALPDRNIVGVDISANMVSQARARCRAHANVRVDHADASRMSEHWRGQVGAVLSCFGLQQLVEPDEALADWAACLAPGGRIAVMLWPVHVEPQGPFATLRALIDERVTPPDRSWEARLSDALTGHGVDLVDDRVVPHSMSHEHPAGFFDAFANSGPGRAMALDKGATFMGELRQAFVASMADGPIEHEPQARLLVGHRPTA